MNNRTTLERITALLPLDDVQPSPESICTAISKLSDESWKSFPVEEVFSLLVEAEDEGLFVSLAGLAERLEARMPIRFLSNLLLSHRLLGARKAAAYALGYSDSDAARKLLEQVAADPQEPPELRGFAIEGLANFGHTDSVDTLIDLVFGEALDPIVAFWTTFALGELGEAKGIPALEALVHDTREGMFSKTVGQEALESLAQLKTFEE